MGGPYGQRACACIRTGACARGFRVRATGPLRPGRGRYARGRPAGRASSARRPGCQCPKSCSGLYPSVLAVPTSGRVPRSPSAPSRRGGPAIRRYRRRRSFGLPHAPGPSRARGRAAPVPEFPPVLEDGTRHADGGGCAQAVVTGAGPVFEGSSPCSMAGQAENPYGDPPSGCPSKPTASETPNPPQTAPSHMFPNQVRD